MEILYTFSEGEDGYLPGSGVVIGPGRTLYGTTVTGGSAGAGTVYALAAPATPGGAWTETVLYSFLGDTDGSAPTWSPVIGSGGVLYGATNSGGIANDGTVFSLTPPVSPGGAWTHAVLYHF
ncbi:MAG TPA: choice-of-anchor tandem repeat GloVer-containing protein [Bryobacteraceae bacterium]|nr:choice-of-anchor tandem repeat GloVer-containing protein [Bryobacteraceae bacterium]